MPQIKRNTIALLASGGSLDVDFLRGIRSFYQPSRKWRLLHRPITSENLNWLLRQDLDGILVHPERSAELEMAVEMHLPTVCTSNRFALPEDGNPNLRLLELDEVEAGRVAAEYLDALGVSHFALIGLAGIRYFRLRRQGFLTYLKSRNLGSQTFWLDRSDPLDVRSAARQEQDDGAIGEWLRQQPTPFAVYTVGPGYADRLLSVCDMVGLQVPERVAVLAGHDQPEVTTLAVPSLSAVRLPMERFGYQAAQLLDDMIDGRKPTLPGRLRPLGVIERDSTRGVVGDDPVLGRAIHFIRRHALAPCRVEDVLEQVNCSRSYLDRACKEATGMSVFQQIRHCQIAAAKRMLAEGSLSVEHVARQCGFSSGMRFSRVFRQETGESPSDYRRSHQV